MDLEREKGITIKARSARLEYTANDGLVYGLNLIDTPGHVDFAYEVSHSLQACEGAILVVDATQGIEAQTLANVHLALRENLTLIPVLNKIDLPSARPRDDHGRAGERPRHPARGGPPRVGQGRHRRGRDPRGDRRPHPGAEGRPEGAAQGPDLRQPLRRVQGRHRLRAARPGHDPPQRRGPADGQRRDRRPARARRLPAAAGPGPAARRRRGGLRRHRAQERPRRPGRRHAHERDPPRRCPAARLPARQEPRVRRHLPGVSGEDYPLLRDALEKLHLNDASFTYEPESSVALGFGFRCGFLGLLHMEIVQERLEREFSLDLIASAPSVEYHVIRTLGRGELVVDNPALLPNRHRHRGDPGAVGQAQRGHARASTSGR